MKKLFLWVITLTFCCFSAIAHAWEECPLGTSIYGQPPPPGLGNSLCWDSDISTGITHFENFWSLTEDIRSITWWGFDFYLDGGIRECTEDPMDFEVAFYPDDGAGKPDTLNPAYILPSVTPTRTPTGQVYGPWGGHYSELNRYHLELDDYVSLTEGWISIRGVSSNGIPEDCFFCWINSPYGDGTHWRITDQGLERMQGNVAYCLGGQYTPVYGACCDLSTGSCDYVDYQDCPPGARFEADTECADLDPPCRTTAFCEDFAGSLGIFTSYEAGDPAGWHWSNSGGNPPGSAYHADDLVDCDDWLISPGGYTVAAGDTLAWDQSGNFEDYVLYHGVLISSDYVNGSDPATATWTEVYAGAAPEDAWETQAVDISEFAGEAVHIAFRYMGNYADEWWVDNVCVFGAGPICVYIPGDCNHNGTPLELADVVSMIGIYRGSAEAEYTCPCPPNGEEFAPEADPNGNCVAFELSDVVTEIGAYRGTAEASGCEDCPGSLRLVPAPPGEHTAMPRLKSKVKVGNGGVSE